MDRCIWAIQIAVALGIRFVVECILFQRPSYNQATRHIGRDKYNLQRFVSFASANRDATRFADAEHFGIHRKIEQYLGFSWGRMSALAGRWHAWGCGWPSRICCCAWAITSCCWSAPSAPQPEPARLPGAADSLLIACGSNDSFLSHAGCFRPAG